MNGLKKIVGGLAVAAMLMGTTAMADPVKIGMITTLSGGGASLGIDTRDGFMLAVKQAANPDVTVLIEDDQQKPDVAVQLADKMIQSDKVDILTGIVWSNLAMAVVPAAVKQGKFYLSTNAAPSQLAGAGCNKNYFSVSYQNDNLHEATGAYANEAGFKKMFIMAPNYPAGKDSLAGFKRFYKGEVVQEVYTQVGQTDYAVEIAQIRASGADGVFMFLPGGMGISFVKQYAESGVKTPLTGPAFSFDQSIIQAMGAAALGVRNGTNWGPDMDNAANKAFVAAFQKEYGRLPSIYGAYGYDTANLMLSALKKAKVTDADAFRAALRAAEFDSVRGAFKFNTNQHPIQDLFVAEVVKSGDILTNKTIEKVMEQRGDAYADQCKM